MNNQPLAQKPSREYLNFKSLQEYCLSKYDLPLSRTSVYRAVRSRKLPSIKNNARRLYRIADVDRWILGGCGLPSDNHKVEGGIK